MATTRLMKVLLFVTGALLVACVALHSWILLTFSTGLCIGGLLVVLFTTNSSDYKRIRTRNKQTKVQFVTDHASHQTDGVMMNKSKLKTSRASLSSYSNNVSWQVWNHHHQRRKQPVLYTPTIMKELKQQNEEEKQPVHFKPHEELIETKPKSQSSISLSASDLNLEAWYQEQEEQKQPVLSMPLRGTKGYKQAASPQYASEHDESRKRIGRKRKLHFELPQDLDDRVSKIWAYGRSNEEFARAWNFSIKGDDLLRLKGHTWLNDEVVNFYFKMIAESTDDVAVHTISSHFYLKLATEGCERAKSFTRKVDIFDFDLILVPIHLKEMKHWCLATINFDNKHITYYDSLNGQNIICLRNLRDYLVYEHRFKLGEELDTSDWVLEHCKNIPMQTNGCDCGVFVCMYARHIAHDLPMDFTQDDIQAIRKMMVAEIVETKLFYYD